MVKITQQVSITLDLLKANVSEAYNTTNGIYSIDIVVLSPASLVDVLDVVSQLWSGLSEGLLQVMQLLASSEGVLSTITERNRNISDVNRTAHEAIQLAEIRANQSLLFEEERLSDNVTANNISHWLRDLEELLQQDYSLLVNVTSNINSTSRDNMDIAHKLHTLQVWPNSINYCVIICFIQECLTTATSFNNSIFAVLRQSYMLQSRLLVEWSGAIEVLQVLVILFPYGTMSSSGHC